MKEYHKIQSIYKRDQKGNFIEGEWSLPEFEYLKDNLWEFTEKVDGTNIRIIWDGESLKYGGRTERAQIPATLIEALDNLFRDKIDLFKSEFPEGVCFYGEGYGLKIQKVGGNYRSDQSFVLFDILVGNWWLKRDACEEIANNFGIDIVPVIKYGTINEAIRDAKEGITSTWGNFQSEGYVLRPLEPLFNRMGNRIITKIKCKDFRVKEQTK